MTYPKIENSKQNRSTKAWLKLIEYVEIVRENELDEFSPREHLGNDLFKEIYTLPESIKELKKVKKIWLYGSSLTSIPPEIGSMESLEYFDPYTSYGLKWFPYEITKCKKLIDSKISTRALFGNYKNKKPFPDLSKNDFRYYSKIMNCSFCGMQIEESNMEQYWISKYVGTDVIPLLVSVCSNSCKNEIDEIEKDETYYINKCHKGGVIVPVSKIDRMNNLVVKGKIKRYTSEELDSLTEKLGNAKPKPLRLIKKIWGK